MKRKGIEMNLKVMMVLVVTVIAVFLIYTLISDNINFLSDYGNQTINNSVEGLF